ncbi:ribokinase [Thermanaeromonas toyohensis ToBE]|uniref:Ribokinase n=1 Tax=Thermanaeromonas toyohensis ToBE TaxID=698762 RepID=A0A1W1VJB4_9FIRM|nr:ribokinase [Thermanaeromonas toyohensis]SMB93452.1 ribokinase [Thermanaeromonas toyohensis ToBE]
MADIVVVGSLNIDFVVKVPRRPLPGETLTGYSFEVIPGGKGANQAVAASKLNGKVSMVGRIGDDVFSQVLRNSLLQAGVDIRGVKVTKGVSTGTAFITVDETGENTIIVIPGANKLCTPLDVDAVEEIISKAKVLLLQLEIPLETVCYAASMAHRYGATVILDPAPAQSLPQELYQLVDIITPNEREAETLTGYQVESLEKAELAALALIERGVKKAILKLGSRGGLLVTEEERFYAPAYQVNALDTTAAGDAFAGGLAVALAEGKDLKEAIIFANAVGALAVTRIGAQTSMPARGEVEEFITTAVIKAG